jgi:predicted metal-binding protein
MKPAVFRDILRSYHQVLVFKIDAPVAVLMGPERLDIARAIHRIAATIEQEALDRCLFLAKGVAAGSCKELFCSQEKGCVVLEKMQPCLHADRARPSLSALGVNFALLAQTAGWKFEKIEEKATSNGEPAMGLMAGMVLLD